MKIKIETIMEVKDEKYWNWIMSLKVSGIPIDGKELLEKGSWSWTTKFPHTEVTTVYEIVKEEEPSEAPV